MLSCGAGSPKVVLDGPRLLRRSGFLKAAASELGFGASKAGTTWILRKAFHAAATVTCPAAADGWPSKLQAGKVAG